jgi:hypothetical protein
VRLLGALLLEQDEAWTTGHRYFDMTSYWQWRDHQDNAHPLGRTEEAVIPRVCYELDLGVR